MKETYLSLVKRIESLSHGKTELVVVSKNRSISDILTLYDAGCRDFGENRVQEALEKMENLPRDIRWHLIGTIQPGKVNKIIGKFYLLHSVDSVELAEKIAKKSASMGVQSRILLQVNISLEETKHGFSEEECREKFSYLNSLEGIQIEGLMTMAPRFAKEKCQEYFGRLRKLKESLSKNLKHLSMGMSEDFTYAILEGATLVRIGSAIFGS